MQPDTCGRVLKGNLRLPTIFHTNNLHRSMPKKNPLSGLPPCQARERARENGSIQKGLSKSSGFRQVRAGLTEYFEEVLQQQQILSFQTRPATTAVLLNHTGRPAKAAVTENNWRIDVRVVSQNAPHSGRSLQDLGHRHRRSRGRRVRGALSQTTEAQIRTHREAGAVGIQKPEAKKRHFFEQPDSLHERCQVQRPPWWKW